MCEGLLIDLRVCVCVQASLITAMDSHVTLKMPNKDDGTVQRGFVQFPIFAALWSEQEFAYKNAESGKEEKKPMDFVLIAGGGGNTKSGVKNCIVSPPPSHPTEHVVRSADAARVCLNGVWRGG